MKRMITPLILLFIGFGCNSSDNDNIAPPTNLPARDMMNVAYGTDPEQKIDLYLPAGRNTDTKVFILVHGGGWSSGSKSDFNYVVPMLKSQFPNYAIINMDYRLATMQSPAYPKQIDDIKKVIDHLQTSDYSISNQYAFIGASAGAHLAMLYSYKEDSADNVKAVCSIVGPTDFSDPSYTDNPMFQYGSFYLIGNIDYAQNPEIVAAVSPAAHVSADSPPTIMFYGGMDPLIPATQGARLKDKLDQFGVYNEYNLYPSGGHGNWNTQTMLDFQTKLIAFFHARF
ncbi:MAG TPA: alpha/beta hydrolase [Flavobacterium sp.]|jgi:acetyl esterase/lipase